MEMIKWAYSAGYRPATNDYYTTTQLGRLEMFKWLHSVNPSFPDPCIAQFAARGDTMALEWLYNNANTMLFVSNVYRAECGAACTYEHTNVLDWLLTKGITPAVPPSPSPRIQAWFDAAGIH
jgi:hypothetical protein